jgi:hypothetical protein
MREDSRSGPVQFDNMQSRQLDGSADWEELHLVLPLDKMRVSWWWAEF